MDISVYPYTHGDPLLIDKIVNEFLSQGKFDKLRKECMSDADTKPAYQNLQQRVETTVAQFLKKQIWRPDLNKNQLRDSLRKHILESGFFDAGINRIVDQVVNPNVLATVFMPEVEEVVYNYLSIPKPTDKNQKKVPASNGDEKLFGNGNDSKLLNAKDQHGKSEKDVTTSTGVSLLDQVEENGKSKNLTDQTFGPETIKTEPGTEGTSIKMDFPIKEEDKIKIESDSKMSCENSNSGIPEKMETPSDESQMSFSRLGVERLRINEIYGVPVPDSDDSAPLEINEKSMSDSRDSEDSIMNQMSPISQGRLTPDVDEEKIEKSEKAEQKPLTFIGRIPKIKREDSESSKSSKPEQLKKEKPESKSIYSSDESDSSKSFGKSDSEDKKGKEKKGEETAQKDEKKRRENFEKDGKHENSSKKSKDRTQEKYKSEKDQKDGRSRERQSSKKSSSSSRERSSSRHSSHRSTHRDSKSKDSEKKKKEEEKKKSKTVDDHGKERNKKENRRSTDRDSNEREREKPSGSRSQGDSRKREKDQKSRESKGERTQKKDSQTEREMDSENVILGLGNTGSENKEGGSVKPQEEVKEVKEVKEMKEMKEVKQLQGRSDPSEECLNFKDLYREGALTRFFFPQITDDFYVKFNSTGFKYFEDWEKTKLDCEEEFKEFVDEAENNLDLLSDEDSDFEYQSGINFQKENQNTIKNLLFGLGNFPESIMFDPKTLDFYSWTNNKFYQKFRKKQLGECESPGEEKRNDFIKKNVVREDSVRRSSDGEKENQGKQKKALHLKLLNKYKRQAMRQRRHKKRPRKPKEFLGGIKEKNENRNAGLTVNNHQAEGFLLRTSNHIKISMEEGSGEEKPPVTETGKLQRQEDDRIGVVVPPLPHIPEDRRYLQWTEPSLNRENLELNSYKNFSSTKTREDSLSLTSLPEKCNLYLNLPLSPDSDDVNANSNDLPERDEKKIKRKRWYKSESEGEGTPKKQRRRNYSQKYESQDLYKPRPILNTSRTRGRDKNFEPELISLGSSISTTNVYNRK